MNFQDLSMDQVNKAIAMAHEDISKQYCPDLETIKIKFEENSFSYQCSIEEWVGATCGCCDETIIAIYSQEVSYDKLA